MRHLIDHTVLKPDATADQVRRLCAEALRHRLYAVCVNGCWVSTAATLLASSPVKVCAVVGFPLGAASTPAKVFEAQQCLRDGAVEIDMVVNIGYVKSGLWDQVYQDVRAVVDVVRNYDASCVCKVIFETCLLTDDEIRRLCEICVESKAHFVKTSTGFSTGGASVHHVQLMVNKVKGRCQVKASGGATRIGTSSSVVILEEAEKLSKI